MKCLLTILLLAAAIPAFAATRTVTFQEGVDGYTGFVDTTIFAESTNSGGGTAAIFVGKNNDGNTRRALLWMDLMSIPPTATITSVTLELSVNNAPNANTPNTFALHKLTASWNAGTTIATSGGGGTGGAPADGDVTWISREHNQSLWATPGGDFLATPSASVVSGPPGTITTWTSTGMVADVQSWVSDPSTNFGWIVIGPETTNQRIRRFDSSEAAALRPKLKVVYSTVDPALLPGPSATSKVFAGVVLASIGMVKLLGLFPSFLAHASH